jgi:hypothetical protein
MIVDPIWCLSALPRTQVIKIVLFSVALPDRNQTKKLLPLPLLLLEEGLHAPNQPYLRLLNYNPVS